MTEKQRMWFPESNRAESPPLTFFQGTMNLVEELLVSKPLRQSSRSMQKVSTLSFVLESASETAGPLSIVPVVGGVQMTRLVEEHDLKIGNRPAGGFGGLVRKQFNFGPWDRYFMAEAPSREIERVGHFLLGCTCGELTCWPLVARILRHGELMVWDHFKQPNRPELDYSSFGPFRFEVNQYRQAVAELPSA
jgi:hypothetical protein